MTQEEGHIGYSYVFDLTGMRTHDFSVFFDRTPCLLVRSYRRLGQNCCIHLHGLCSTTRLHTLYTKAALFRRNVSKYSPMDTASYRRRLKSLKLLWNRTAVIIFSVTRSGRCQIVIWFSCKVNSQLNCQMCLRCLYLTHSVCETWLLNWFPQEHKDAAWPIITKTAGLAHSIFIFRSYRWKIQALLY